MPASLATVEELESRLGYPLEGEDRTMAEAVLADISAIVRTYGLPWPDPATAPDVVKTVVLAASERKMRNPEGFRSEIEGTYQYHLPAGAVTGTALTDAERRLIQHSVGLGGVFSVPIASHGGAV